MNARVTVPEAELALAQRESGWTETRTRVAFALFAAGKSDSQVACMIGGVTRNAVIGKRSRAGIFVGTSPQLLDRPRVKGANGLRAGEPRAAPRPVRAAVPRPKGLKASEPPLPHVDDAAISIEQRRSLAELTDDCCHWPVGDPMQPGFFFCGAVVSQPDPNRPRPYCPSHMRRAHDYARGPSRGASGRPEVHRGVGDAWR